MTTNAKLGVHSETGKLRQVIVCRPGLAHRLLTHSNCQELLFDDVFWVKQAQKDHDVLASLMRNEGVEVLAFRIPESRAAMHLDTIFTLCGGDVVTTFKEVADELVC